MHVDGLTTQNVRNTRQLWQPRNEPRLYALAYQAQLQQRQALLELELNEAKEKFKDFGKKVKEVGKRSLKNVAEVGKRSLKDVKEAGRRSLKDVKDAGKQSLKDVRDAGKRSLRKAADAGKRSLKKAKKEGFRAVADEAVKETKESCTRLGIDTLKNLGVAALSSGLALRHYFYMNSEYPYKQLRFDKVYALLEPGLKNITDFSIYPAKCFFEACYKSSPVVSAYNELGRDLIVNGSPSAAEFQEHYANMLSESSLFAKIPMQVCFDACQQAIEPLDKYTMLNVATVDTLHSTALLGAIAASCVDLALYKNNVRNTVPRELIRAGVGLAFCAYVAFPQASLTQILVGYTAYRAAYSLRIIANKVGNFIQRMRSSHS
jgi:hypothetical protein